MGTLCYVGAKDICDAIGENSRNIAILVLDKGLPAWKTDSKGTWKALPEDLKRWLKNQRDMHLPNNKESIKDLTKARESKVFNEALLKTVYVRKENA